MASVEFDKFKKLCINAKIYHKTDLIKKTQDCKEIIKKTEKCLCLWAPHAKFMSNDLLHFLLVKCKQNCQLCQYKKTADLIKFYTLFDFTAINKLISISEIAASERLLDHVILHHCNEIPNCDIAAITNMETIRLSAASMAYLFDTVYNTIFAKEDPTKLNAFKLLNRLIIHPRMIEDHWELLYEFAILMYLNGYISFVHEDRLVALFQYNPAELFSMTIGYTHNNNNPSSLVAFILGFYETIHVCHADLFYVDRLPETTKSGIYKKMSNLIELVSCRYHKSIHNSSTVDLNIVPSDILTSIFVFNGSFSKIIYKLMSKKKLYICYMDEYGNETGVDAGGLTRDFYTSFAKQILSYFEEVDGYLLPKKKVLNVNQWFVIGILLSRSIFCENISPSIPFHPILSYLLLY
jgi:hypothetical protein